MLTIHFLPSSIYSFIPSSYTAPTFVSSFDYMLQVSLPTKTNQAHLMLLWLNLHLSFNKNILLQSPSAAIFTMGIQNNLHTHPVMKISYVDLMSIHISSSLLRTHCPETPYHFPFLYPNLCQTIPRHTI